MPERPAVERDRAAEDVLQETWLAWVPRNQAPDATPIDNTRAYLVRIARTHRRRVADRRDRTGISYLITPQWHVDDFAPVVDRLAGD